MTTPWKRIIALGFILGIVGLVMLALLPKPISVVVTPAEWGPLQVTVDEEGETRIRDRFTVAAPVSGRLLRIALRDGDPVALNQVVAEVWPLPLSAREREEQQARVLAAEALQRQAEEQVRRAQTDYEQARRERERMERLASAGLVSPQATEQARVIEITDANQVQAARFRAVAAAAEVQVARAGLIALETPDEGIVTTVKVPSPIAGKVLRVLEQSERVVEAGTALLIIGDPSNLEVVLDVLSTEAVKVQPGMPVILEGWGGNQPLRAQVRVVEPFAFTKVSALGVEEQRVNIIADFIDPPGPLGDGYRVEGRIVIWEQSKVLKIPASSLFRVGTGWSVFVVENGRAQRRQVEVGHRSTLEVEIISGLRAGEQVIRHPSNQLREGTRVATG
jgi:HlyD family secretion protein